MRECEHCENCGEFSVEPLHRFQKRWLCYSCFCPDEVQKVEDFARVSAPDNTIFMAQRLKGLKAFGDDLTKKLARVEKKRIFNRI